MHFTRLSAYDRSAGPDDRPRRGPVHLRRRTASATSTGSPACSSCRPGTAARSWPTPRRSRPAELAYFPLWSYAHPKAVELADRLADLAPGRPEPGLLHHRRLGGGRGRLEARPVLLQAGRQADQAQGDLAAHRLPRHLDGRPVDHRAARHQGGLRAAGAVRRPGAEHQPLPRAGGHGRSGRHRRRGVRTLGGRPDRRGDRVRGTGHGRGGVPGAGAELRRLLPAPARVLRPGPGDLRRVRRAARLRRGDLRVRPARRVLRVHPVRLPARHHHLRQGHDERIRPARRDDRLGPAGRAVPAPAPTGSPTA